MIVTTYSLLAALVCGYIAYVTLLRENKLSKFPGPRLAAFTDLWVVWRSYIEGDEEPMRTIHERYGPVVRTAPNKLAFADPAAIKDIYGASNDLNKSSYYSVAATTNRGIVQHSLFTTPDMKYHDTIRRVANKPFSMSVVPSYEPRVESVVDLWMKQIRLRFADKAGREGVFDLGKWCQYFALDSISNVAFSQPYGFLESDRDVANLMSDNRTYLRYLLLFANAPWLDKLMMKNPLLLWLNSHGYLVHDLIAFSTPAEVKARREKELSAGAPYHADILDMLIEIRGEKPDIMGDDEIFSLLIGVVFAGADNTAVLIAATFRYLLKHPSIYAKLLQEIDGVSEFSYANRQKVPYLDAVLKEVARMFPVVRFNLERMTPPQGMKIAGVEVPGGVEVSTNAWIIHRDPAIWGEDVDIFRPERWLVDEETSKAMASRLHLFGAGKFSCIGMHIAWTEIFKVVPMMLKAFRFELANVNTDWRWGPTVITYVDGLDVRAYSR